MRQIMGDSDVMAMISEMYFEQHFDAPEMEYYFHKLQTTLSDVQQSFQSFRSKGLRLHYWP